MNGLVGLVVGVEGPHLKLKGLLCLFPSSAIVSRRDPGITPRLREPLPGFPARLEPLGSAELQESAGCALEVLSKDAQGGREEEGGVRFGSALAWSTWRCNVANGRVSLTDWEKRSGAQMMENINS